MCLIDYLLALSNRTQVEMVFKEPKGRVPSRCRCTMNNDDGGRVVRCRSRGVRYISEINSADKTGIGGETEGLVRETAAHDLWCTSRCGELEVCEE